MWFLVILASSLLSGGSWPISAIITAWLMLPLIVPPILFVKYWLGRDVSGRSLAWSVFLIVPYMLPPELIPMATWFILIPYLILAPVIALMFLFKRPRHCTTRRTVWIALVVYCSVPLVYLLLTMLPPMSFSNFVS